jgi:hypothetical protein
MTILNQWQAGHFTAILGDTHYPEHQKWDADERGLFGFTRIGRMKAIGKPRLRLPTAFFDLRESA